MSPISVSNRGGGSGSFELHQREILRIHELWNKAKSELKHKSYEIDQLRARCALACCRAYSY
eukprot:g5999.t1